MRYIFLIIFVFIPRIAFALPAFPGCLNDWGGNTIHGRGGTLIKVTNTNNTGTGSLREALTTSGARIIVFTVGGIIDIETYIKISDPYVYIAAQTAPGNGICLRAGESLNAAPIVISTHDVLIRGLRIRPGDANDEGTKDNRDALQIEDQPDQNDVYNIVIDHCSFTWSVDETICAYYDGHDLIFMNNIIAEPLADSIHGDVHDMGPLVYTGWTKVLFWHNLFTAGHDRFPRFRGTSGAHVNNVHYNSYWRNSNFAAESEQNMSVIGNWYDKGTSTTTLAPIHIETAPGDTEFYITDNYCADWAGTCVNNAGGAELVETAPIWPTGLITSSATDAKIYVLANAGPMPGNQDAVDNRIIAYVNDDTGAPRPDSPSDVGGYPTYPTGTYPTDSDNDGMSDAWEISTFGDLTRTANADEDSDGYHNIEEYLHSFYEDSVKKTLTGNGNQWRFNGKRLVLE